MARDFSCESPHSNANLYERNTSLMNTLDNHASCGACIYYAAPWLHGFVAIRKCLRVIDYESSRVRFGSEFRADASALRAHASAIEARLSLSSCDFMKRLLQPWSDDRLGGAHGWAPVG